MEYLPTKQDKLNGTNETLCIITADYSTSRNRIASLSGIFQGTQQLIPFIPSEIIKFLQNSENNNKCYTVAAVQENETEQYDMFPAPVYCCPEEKPKFLTTNPNDTTKDNLGELPTQCELAGQQDKLAAILNYVASIPLRTIC